MDEINDFEFGNQLVQDAIANSQLSKFAQSTIDSVCQSSCDPDCCEVFFENTSGECTDPETVDHSSVCCENSGYVIPKEHRQLSNYKYAKGYQYKWHSSRACAQQEMCRKPESQLVTTMGEWDSFTIDVINRHGPCILEVELYHLEKCINMFKGASSVKADNGTDVAPAQWHDSKMNQLFGYIRGNSFEYLSYSQVADFKIKECEEDILVDYPPFQIESNSTETQETESSERRLDAIRRQLQNDPENMEMTHSIVEMQLDRSMCAIWIEQFSTYMEGFVNFVQIDVDGDGVPARFDACDTTYGTCDLSTDSEFNENCDEAAALAECYCPPCEGLNSTLPTGYWMECQCKTCSSVGMYNVYSSGVGKVLSDVNPEIHCEGGLDKRFGTSTISHSDCSIAELQQDFQRCNTIGWSNYGPNSALLEFAQPGDCTTDTKSAALKTIRKVGSKANVQGMKSLAQGSFQQDIFSSVNYMMSTVGIAGLAASALTSIMYYDTSIPCVGDLVDTGLDLVDSINSARQLEENMLNNTASQTSNNNTANNTSDNQNLSLDELKDIAENIVNKNEKDLSNLKANIINGSLIDQISNEPLGVCVVDDQSGKEECCFDTEKCRIIWKFDASIEYPPYFTPQVLLGIDEEEEEVQMKTDAVDTDMESEAYAAVSSILTTAVAMTISIFLH
eukprot:GHVL01017366.1.p1 GENE.GHVL01017366.1~~GHVL01017366.1.p1  ORF type:complete len:676 (-),score=162.13 GHVL01017366.1:1937-3964(-)